MRGGWTRLAADERVLIYVSFARQLDPDTLTKKAAYPDLAIL